MPLLRAALTQTVNAYHDMPGSVDDLNQLAGTLDKVRQANIDHHLDLVSKAAGLGASVICLGELFTAPYFALSRDPLWLDLAEDAANGPTVSAMRTVAAQNEIVTIAPIYELDPETGNRYNTAVVVDADGTILGKYRKVHIPVGSNESGCFDERFYYDPAELPINPPSPKILGNNPYFPVFSTAVGRIGVAICYDRHFEGVVRSLSKAGAQLIFCPAVTFGRKSERMWEIEFEVDAARHRVFIGGSNRSGTEPPWNQPYFGRSHFAGPEGRIEPIRSPSQLIIADLDLHLLEETDSSGWNLPRDARPDIYS